MEIRAFQCEEKNRIYEGLFMSKCEFLPLNFNLLGFEIAVQNMFSRLAEAGSEGGI